jgi:hypothetical protein
LPMCPDSPRGSRSGSLVLPRPLLGLSRRRLALEVFRGLRAADVPKNFDAWPPWPSLPFRAPVPPGPDGFRPSSRGIRPASASLRAPLGSPPSAWLPEFTPARPHGRASASREPPSPHVPPSWFRTTSAVSSSGSSRACCIPLPILGFVAFPSGSTRFVKVRRPLAEPNTAFPATFVSLRRMSSTAAVPRHRGQSSAVESVTPHRRCQR